MEEVGVCCVVGVWVEVGVRRRVVEMDDGANVFKFEGFEMNGFDLIGDDFVVDVLKMIGVFVGIGYDVFGL